jgi:ectoine hydroxylase-related dioxygenase (phytanoyl-CoA dioxygenase family)
VLASQLGGQVIEQRAQAHDVWEQHNPSDRITPGGTGELGRGARRQLDAHGGHTGAVEGPTQVPVLGCDTDVDAITNAIDEAGCVVIDRLVDPSVMDDVERELRPHLDDARSGPDDFSGHNTRRTGLLIARSPTFRDLAAHPVVLGTLDHVLGDHCTSYQLHLTQIIDIGPGEPAQTVHRDQWAFDFFPFPAGFEVECHTMWALTDFTEANGATRVVPGSHRWGDKLRLGEHDTVPAEMGKGSVLIYIGSLYHGGGANRSDTHRLGINVGYTLSWLRQEENQYLACPPEIARTLPIPLAKLIGYQRGAYALGYVGDLEDPLELLHPGSTAAGFSARS